MDTSQPIIINEIAWMGSPVEGVDAKQWWRYEWLELYNLSDTDISVAGWSVEVSRENLDFIIPLQGFISSEGYFLAAASHKVSGTDINYASLAGKFVNSGQQVVLRDRTGVVVDQVDATAGWFAGDNDSKLTMERRFPDRDANDQENWGSSLTTGGTPKAENSIFGKEAVLNLDEQMLFTATQKNPGGLSVFEGAVDGVFIFAFLVALGAALFVVFLRRYLAPAP